MTSVKYFFWFMFSAMIFLFIFGIAIKILDVEKSKHMTVNQYDDIRNMLMTIKKNQDTLSIKQNLMKIKQDSMSKFFDLQENGQ